MSPTYSSWEGLQILRVFYILNLLTGGIQKVVFNSAIELINCDATRDQFFSLWTTIVIEACLMKVCAFHVVSIHKHHRNMVILSKGLPFDKNNKVSVFIIYGFDFVVFVIIIDTFRPPSLLHHLLILVYVKKGLFIIIKLFRRT